MTVEQVTAFADLPAPSVPTHRYVCTACGGKRVAVDPTRPALDSRFAVGRCGDCDKSQSLVEEHLYAGVRRQQEEKKARESRAREDRKSVV